MTSTHIYYCEYCPVCNKRACESQRSDLIRMTKCVSLQTESQRYSFKFVCDELFCCHGCSCLINNNCTSVDRNETLHHDISDKRTIDSNMKCCCDCHCETITLPGDGTEKMKSYTIKFNKTQTL